MENRKKYTMRKNSGINSNLKGRTKFVEGILYLNIKLQSLKAVYKITTNKGET